MIFKLKKLPPYIVGMFELYSSHIIHLFSKRLTYESIDILSDKSNMLTCDKVFYSFVFKRYNDNVGYYNRGNKLTCGNLYKQNLLKG